MERSRLDTYWEEGSPNRIRCKDRYGDEGTIVGYHDRIVLSKGNTDPWFWVLRDRDNAVVGIKECNLVSNRK